MTNIPLTEYEKCESWYINSNMRVGISIQMTNLSANSSKNSFLGFCSTFVITVTWSNRILFSLVNPMFIVSSYYLANCVV